MGRRGPWSERGRELVVQRALLSLRLGLLGQRLLERRDDRIDVHRVVKVAPLDQPVLANECERLDRQAALVCAGRAPLAVDKAAKPVGDGVALEFAAGELDMRARMPAHVIRLKHAQRRERPAQACFALVERSRDRQRVTFGDRCAAPRGLSAGVDEKNRQGRTSRRRNDGRAGGQAYDGDKHKLAPPGVSAGRQTVQDRHELSTRGYRDPVDARRTLLRGLEAARRKDPLKGARMVSRRPTGDPGMAEVG